MQITEEQNNIIDCDLEPGQILKVMAFAGTGKTTTLVEYARKRPHIQFLYIAFNKSVQLEAAAKFPSNVTARTSHALAFRSKGYMHKERLVPGFRANQVMEALGVKQMEDARFAIDTLNNYLVSADAKVTRRHIPGQAHGFYQSNGKSMPDLVELANQLGRFMCKGGSEEIGMLHDGYLKLFQLSAPVLPYDCILLDEAQDINPVTASLVLSQADPNLKFRPSSIIMVGDNHQQIYSFRGARDTLKTLEADHTRYLTQSFRFDNNVARVANMILGQFKGEKRPIRGTPVDRPTKPKWDNGNCTIIARTNAALFDRAVGLYRKEKIGFTGGVGGYRLDILKDVFYLYSRERERIRDNYIKGFETFGDLRSYARTVEDMELLSVCAVVEKYTGAIPKHVEGIMDRAVDVDQAGVVLTTAHKAKGLEWDNVLLMDDFTPLMQDDRLKDSKGTDPDEYNLIYVAMTRARINLRFHKQSDIPAFIRLYQRRKKEAGPGRG
ncbi:MAG: UvrD-helicase domain-containing protein [Desulfobacterales bacterium]|nr:UvrD-helicase domain-containing protein [Desulfobacterales bacterium]